MITAMISESRNIPSLDIYELVLDFNYYIDFFTYVNSKPHINTWARITNIYYDLIMASWALFDCIYYNMSFLNHFLWCDLMQDNITIFFLGAMFSKSFHMMNYVTWVYNMSNLNTFNSIMMISVKHPAPIVSAGLF